MMRRKLLSLSAVILTIALVFVIAVCVSCCPGTIPSDDSNPQGLEFTLKDEGTYLVEIGNATYLSRIEIPAYYKGVAVTEIGHFGSETGYSNLKEIVIPSTVTRIGDSAFKGCINLTSIEIPESVTSIGDSAFTDCYKLVEVINKSSLKIFAGSFDYGNVAKYAKEVHNGASKVINADGYLFYTYNYTTYLLGTTKTDTALVLPESYGGGSYELYSYAFYNNDSIRSVIISGGVKAIGTNAFKSCDRLSEMTVGASVERIDASAFEGCNGLTKITLPFVGSAKFGGSTYFGHIFGAMSAESQKTSIPATLKTVKINGTVDISAKAFYGCTGLTSVEISGEVKKIGAQAFAGCTGLTGVLLGDSVKTIDVNAFNGCTKLSGVTFSRNLTEIGEGAFESTALKSLVLPDSVEKIDKNAFKSCANLSSVVMGKAVASIGESAFEGCTALESITIPFIGAALDDELNNHFGYIFGAIDNDELDDVYAYQIQKDYIPASLINVKVIGGSAVPAYAFYGCGGIKSVELSGGITAVGIRAFENCTGLQSVLMLENVGTIGEWAFNNCSSLSDIRMGKKLTSIGDRAFSGCSALESVVIPDGVTTIADGVFYNCTSLKNVTLSKGLTDVAGFAFWGCPVENVYISDLAAWCGVSLENYSSNPMHNGASLYVGGNLIKVLDTATLITGTRVSEIKKFSFYGCASITDLVISDTIATISESAFASCDNLSNVVFGNALETIGESAFEGCGNIISIEIGDSIMSIEASAFENCYRLVEVIDKSSLDIVVGSTANGYVAYYAIEVHTEGSRIVRSGDYLFYSHEGVNSLVGYVGSATDIVLPDNYNGETYSINQYAFYNNKNIKSIVIPGSIGEIGRGAFQGCDSLASITLPFVGKTDNAATNNHFGYIFGAAYYDTQKNYVPASLKTVTIAGGTTIAPKAFYGCSGINNVIISDSIEYIGACAFEGCSSLSEMTLPFVGETPDAEELTYIGHVFGASSYSTQKEFVPASLKTIKFTGKTGVSNYAFYNCPGIESVVLPDSVPFIGDHSFDGCTGLTSIEIGKGVKSIGIMAFFGCTQLNGVVLPDGLTTIGVMAFEGCTSIESIVVPDSVIRIDASAFEGCTSLNSITLPFVGQEMDSQINSYFGYIFGASSYGENKIFVPASLKTVVFTSGSRIDAYTFFECSGLESVTLSPDVLNIDYMSFYGCSSLADITLGSKIESIATKAFMGCSSLQSIVVPNSVISIGESAFEGCTALESITLPFVGAIKDSASNGHFGYIFGARDYDSQGTYVPSSLKKVVINGGSIVDAYAFYNCADLIEIEIADGVKSIGESAFVGCSALTRVLIGDSVETISNNAFYNCRSLSEVILGESIVTIGASAFEGCVSLLRIDIPDSTTTIGDNAFKSCSKLAALTLGESVVSIGASAFEGCESLMRVDIPENLESMGASAFKGCNSLTAITLPFLGATAERDGTTYFGYIFGAHGYYFQKDYVPASLRSVTLTGGSIIETNDFYECAYLTHIEIRSGIHTIAASAFIGCKDLTRVVINGIVTSIGDGAFKGCDKLSEVVLGAYIETIGASAFEGCKSLVSVYVPGSVTVIGNSAFKSCEKLSAITLGNSLTTIGQSAFEDCVALVSVVVPASVDSIGASAFKGCTALESITLPFIGASASGDVATYFGYVFGAPDHDTQDDYVPASLVSVKITGGTSVAPHAFSECESIKSIELPASISSIGVMAFYKCSSLESFVIPAGVTVIDSKTFLDCTSLTDVVIPDSVTSIGIDAFNNCSSLESIVIPSGVVSIGDFAFYGCKGIVTVYYAGSEEEWNSISIGSYNEAIKNSTLVYNYN